MRSGCGLANNETFYNITRNGSVYFRHSSNEFPWHAFLIVKDIAGGLNHCSGFLIDSKWILTAANCFIGRLNRLYKI